MTDLQRKVALKYGLLLGGIQLLLGILTTFLFDPDTPQHLALLILVVVSGIAMIVIPGLAHIEFNRKNNHTLLFKDAIVIGLVVLGIAFVISLVYNYINMEFLLKDKIANSQAMMQPRYGAEVTEQLHSPKAFLLSSLSSLLLQIVLLLLLIMVEAQWKVYTKAGKEGWASLVPVYNIIILLEIVQKPIWWLFMLIIPGVNIIFAVRMVNSLAKRFGKGDGFTAGLIFLPFVFYPLLGMSDAEYDEGEHVLIYE